MSAVSLFILFLTVGLLFIGVIGSAFADVGFSPIMVGLILISTFIGSFINIPISRLRTKIPIVKDGFVRFFGMVYRIPQVEYGEQTTLIAVNLGGALIPALVSIYLMWRQPSIIFYAVAGITIVMIITKAIAKPVRGRGITMPAFVSPLVAAAMAYLLPSGVPTAVAYISGVLGTLIGADLLNLNAIPDLGAPMVSIGGAGTFDGVFMSGIIAVLLV
jgi:uncharacterized membrane protein